jgi:hypothetical protein
MNNGLSNVNDPNLRPLAVDVNTRNQRERKGRRIVVIIVLSSVFAFILCAGGTLAIYFNLTNRNHLTEASIMPAKPPGNKTFYSRVLGRLNGCSSRLRVKCTYI